VAFIDDIAMDLSRRDFTVNAMAFDLSNNHFVDPFGGRNDLAAKVIRAVGDPFERFSEDGLRTLRAIRFAAQLGFVIEPATLKAVQECREKLACVSRERIRDEFSKIVCAQKPSRGIKLLADTSLILDILPEILSCKHVPQPRNYHKLDVFDHLLATVDAVNPDNLSEERLLVLRLAALLHDIGKPRTLNIDKDGTVSFYGHEIESEAIARKTLQDLKYPNEIIDRVCHLVRHHMFNYEPGWTDAAVRRFVARVGQRAIPDLFALRLADTIATAGEPVSWPLLSEFQARIDRVLEEKQALSLRDLAVSGDDLASIGIPRNREMGALLSELLEAVLEDQSLNTREKLLEIAKAKYFNVVK
jgi:poly(A) polymerase/tRNA nucleotidyltransferase (CCA-adding enzyme)